jgi:hypothetical protein
MSPMVGIKKRRQAAVSGRERASTDWRARRAVNEQRFVTAQLCAQEESPPTKQLLVAAPERSERNCQFDEELLIVPRGRRVSRTTVARVNPWYHASRMAPEGQAGL